MKRLTLEKAKELTVGTVLSMNDSLNADGTCIRWRVSGKPKTWKTRKNEVKVPVKHGLYHYGYITHENIKMFHYNGTCEKCN